MALECLNRRGHRHVGRSRPGPGRRQEGAHAGGAKQIIATAIGEARRPGAPVRLVQGQWRYRDAEIVEAAHRAVGPDLRPSGPPNRTYDIAPHAGGADFDDSAWEVLPASRLQARKGNGRLSFNWYRTTITIPDRIGAFDPTGSTVGFEIVVDDYAEVWVDGRLPNRWRSCARSRPGSNGLALDREGRLTISEHGNRRAGRAEAGEP